MTTLGTPRIVVTGNGAFGDTAARRDLTYTDNPSSTIAALLDGEVIAGHRIQGVSLDWDHHPIESLEPLFSGEGTVGGASVAPVAVLSLGVFSGRTTVTIERLAANVQDFQFADNGFRPAGSPVVTDGPAAYFATLPIKGIASRIRDTGIPALVSNSASTHGCNSVMYTALHLIATRGLPTLAGFIHLPDPPGHIAALGSNGPSMSLDHQVQAVRAAIQATIEFGSSDLELPANEWEW